MRVRDSGFTKENAFLLPWKSSSYHVRKAVSWLNRQQFSAHEMVVQVSPRVYSKYRRKIIYNQYRESSAKYSGNSASTKCRNTRGHLISDHVHMLVAFPPKWCIHFMGYLKGKSALMMFDAHANLKTSLATGISGRKATTLARLD
jgi:hypothetical protein